MTGIFLFFFACGYRGHSLPTVVLPPALICPLVPKHSHPFPASSSAFTFHCFMAVFNLNPPFTSSLPFPLSSYWPFYLYFCSFYFFISFTISCFISLSVSLCPQQASVFVSPSSSSPFFTPTRSLCSRSPHFLSLSLAYSLALAEAGRVCVWWLRWNVWCMGFINVLDGVGTTIGKNRLTGTDIKHNNIFIDITYHIAHHCLPHVVPVSENKICNLTFIWC